jgi:hypothetical protein
LAYFEVLQEYSTEASWDRNRKLPSIVVFTSLFINIVVFVGFEVLTAVAMKSTDFWDITP